MFALCICPHSNGAEEVLQRLIRSFEAGVHEPNERELIAIQRVADWSVAAARVPTKQAIVRETHARQGCGTLDKSDVLRQRLNYIRPSPLIENLAFPAQEVCKSLTVLAVTHRAVCTLRIFDESLDSAAPTLQWMLPILEWHITQSGQVACQTGAA